MLKIILRSLFYLFASLGFLFAQNSYWDYQSEFYEKLSYKSLAGSESEEFSELISTFDEDIIKIKINEYLSKYNFVEEYILLAKLFDDKNNFESLNTAVYILESGIKKHYDNKRLSLYLGLLYEKISVKYSFEEYYRVEFRKKAVSLYRKLLKNNSEYFPAKYNLTRIYLDSLLQFNHYEIVNHNTYFNGEKYNTGSEENRITEVSEELFLKEDSTIVYPKLNTKEFDNILAAFQIDSERYFDFFETYNLVSELYFRTGRFDEGINYLTKNINKISDTGKIAVCNFWLAVFYFKIEKYESASIHFSRAFEYLSEDEKNIYLIDSFDKIMSSKFGPDYLLNTEEDKFKIVSDYLSANDPYCTTNYNELQLEHFYRVFLAGKRFLSEEKNAEQVFNALRSNQGDIFIRYGEPVVIYDLRSDYGMDMEVWEYNNVKFIFTDILENGNYVLADRKTVKKHKFTGENYSSISADILLKELPSVHYICKKELPNDIKINIYQFKKNLLSSNSPTEIVTSFNLNPDHKFDKYIFSGVVKSENENFVCLKTEFSETFKQENNLYSFSSDGKNGEIITEIKHPERFEFSSNRSGIQVKDFNSDSLQISDLIFASDVLTKPTQKTGLKRNEITVFPKYNFEFKNNEPVHLYLEVYNLNQKNRQANYQREIIIKKEDDSSFFENVLSLFSSSDDVKLSTSTENIAYQKDDQIYLKLDMTKISQGSYKIIVRITDNLSKQIVETSRQFRIIEQ